MSKRKGAEMFIACFWDLRISVSLKEVLEKEAIDGTERDRLLNSCAEEFRLHLILERVTNTFFCASLAAQTVKEFVCNAEDVSSIPASGRSPGEGNGYPLEYSCLENFMDRGSWQATVHGVAKNQTRLSN